MRLRTGMKVWTNTSNELTTTPNELTTTNEFTITKIIELTEQTGELSNKAFLQGDVLNWIQTLLIFITIVLVLLTYCKRR